MSSNFKGRRREMSGKKTDLSRSEGCSSSSYEFSNLCFPEVFFYAFFRSSDVSLYNGFIIAKKDNQFLDSTCKANFK
jgi:hypothetical protein